MNEGYIKAYRKTMKSRVFKNEGLFKVWMWCLWKASYSEQWVILKTGKGSIEVHLLPGQFIFGRESAAKELGMKPSTVRNRMQKLKKMGNLDIKVASQYSIIIIINWDTYQALDEKEDSRKDRQRTGKGHIQEGKEGKENKGPFPSGITKELPDWLNKDLWEEFRKHRKTVKASMTELAEKKLLMKLERLIQDTGASQEDIIEQSIMNGWKGLFEVKDHDKRKERPEWA